MFDPRAVDMIMALRSRGISDAATLRAMEQTPRKSFLEPEWHERAYEPLALPIACGQEISAPLSTAMLVQMLGAGPDSKVLEIGTGTGWMSAVLSQMCRRVYSVERYTTLIQRAETRLKDLGVHNIVIRHGDGRHGWPGQAPFKHIVLGCAVRAVPDRLLDQLGPNGRLVAVVDGTLTLVERARKHLSETEIMPMELPMIESGKSKTL